MNTAETCEINDGGPAFPTITRLRCDAGGPDYSAVGITGMTLRDYIAAQVAPTYAQMNDGTTGPCYDAKIKLWSPSAVARQAYLVADAMLLERNREL